MSNIYIEKDYDWAGNFKNLRMAHGYSQKEMGKFCGISRESIFSFEQNECDMSIKNLDKMANKFNISIDGILSGKHEERKEKTSDYSKRMKLALENKHMTTGELSRELGYYWDRVREQIIKNYIPITFLMFCTAKILDTTIDYLLGYGDD